MKVLGFIYTTDNNILTFNMTTFIPYDCFNATAEPRDCVDNIGLIYRINSSLDTFLRVIMLLCGFRHALPTIRSQK